MIATVGRGAGMAGSVTRSPATAICPAAKCSSNDPREIPAARKRSSTVTPSPSTTPRSSATAPSVARRTDKSRSPTRLARMKSGTARSAHHDHAQVAALLGGRASRPALRGSASWSSCNAPNSCADIRSTPTYGRGEGMSRRVLVMLAVGMLLVAGLAADGWAYFLTRSTRPVGHLVITRVIECPWATPAAG